MEGSNTKLQPQVVKSCLVNIRKEDQILNRVKYKVKNQQRHQKSFKVFCKVSKLLKKLFATKDLSQLDDLIAAVEKCGELFHWNIEKKLFVPYSVIMYSSMSRLFFLLSNIKKAI
ncbi:unnamed protein product [Moneuplotes crassus]|uniref:Nucleolus and neural progenitor protein-like N-terminal domain-containing protein n=1 Tax=Euplotes crassus TaxID=5936 RepID=A0AAD2D8E1_EUPCR|nr:unnamed protein product [Moneuplotes crassus]